MANWWSPLRAVLPQRYAGILRRERGLETVGDLLRFRPRRFIDGTGDIGDLHLGDYVVFIGVVGQVRERQLPPRGASRRPRTLINAEVSSGIYTIELTFFTRYPHIRELRKGRRGLFAGKVSQYRGTWQLAHPTYEFLPEETAETVFDVEPVTGRQALQEFGRRSGVGSDGERAGPGEQLVEGRNLPLDAEFEALMATAFPDGNAELSSKHGLGTLLNRDRIPVYRQVKGMGPGMMSRAVQLTLAAADLPDPLPNELRMKRGLAPYVQAWHDVHLPGSDTEYFNALRRLKYDEAIVMQLELARRRAAEEGVPAVPRTARPGGLLEAFDAALPFVLTDGQVQVGEEIASDLARSRPMNRLLQGEVGSGKTVVALRAMLAVIDAGGQAALLAPTEVLAQQHHRSLLELLGPLAEGGLLGGAEQGTRVALLTGSATSAQRKQALLQAASGEAGIVVGTHALLEEKVQFADLGLVVVDEQHRFGVEQRDALRAKGTQAPHMLVMTATPIPRTVAMTVFGDMETSTLRALPPGRSAVQTTVVTNPRWYARAWERVAEEVADGHQVYVVCPRIGDEPEGAATSYADGFDEAVDPSHRAIRGGARGGQESCLFTDLGDPLEAADNAGAEPTRAPMRGVLETFAELQANPVLAGVRMAVLHGRMPADEKDATMRAFTQGRIDVLVSTTVIEVGVDVANATMMVILDADRFGVSQLHQLRGRVGRGSHPGLCLLVSAHPTEGGEERLNAVAATTDGFELAHIDLMNRREGDVLGARQSGGGSKLQFLRLTGREDVTIIEMAREDALAAYAADPQLTEFTDLARILDDHLDDEAVDYLKKG